jgi:prolyl 4-hydroxylase
MRMIIEPEFLNEREVTELIVLIRRFAEKHPLLTGSADYLTSSTVYLSHLSDRLVRSLEVRIADELELDYRCGEGIQGAWYRPGEGYKILHDAFHKSTPEFEKFTVEGGNRTWSAMIYLNTVYASGQTVFDALGISIRPRAGELVAWSNLDEEGYPNVGAWHSAEPPDDQPKYVLTEWFRERPIR